VHIKSPEELHPRAKALAKDKVWSFTAVVRLGLE